ncbi:MAG: methylmalonyl-CoA mutase, partial [Hyphomicrobiaceae bacterium]|nr:methylmalonyl-CoA mutase [Hyphomicrobiaceae bacterium]
MTPSTFASAFDRATDAQWRALVDKALKGADFEKRLIAKSADGIAVKPLYTRADAMAELPPPGQAPFTRGRHATVPGLGWDITTVVDAGDAAAANRAILADLEGGANAVLVVVEAAGQPGVAVKVGDWPALLSGVYLDLATVELDAGLGGLKAAQGLHGALGSLGGAAGTRRFQLNLDPIGTLARTGTVGERLDTALAEFIRLAIMFRTSEPLSRTVLASGLPYHEAGGSEAQELAAMAATLIAYLRAFEAAGVDPGAGLAQCAVHLAADADIFATAAKLRAARSILARVAEACGVAPAAGDVRLTAVSSRRMMARRDPWTNMLRTTVATAAASFGGADAILTRPFTDALGEADVFARRIARNTQIVAQEESGLGRVIDPAGGSWYVERLTADLAAEAWGLLQEIEAEGGIVAALKSQFIQGRIAAVAAQRAKAIATGRIELTGVSAFPKLGDDGVTITPRRPAPTVTAPAEVMPLVPIRLAAPFEALRDA